MDSKGLLAVHICSGSNPWDSGLTWLAQLSWMWSAGPGLAFYSLHKLQDHEDLSLGQYSQDEIQGQTSTEISGFPFFLHLGS